MCDLVDHGEIVSVDIAPQSELPKHPRVEYITASSVDPSLVAELTQRCSSLDRVMVILDSDHAAEHVGHELDSYAPLVTMGSYLIVEDTNVNGHPVFPAHGAGPMEALDKFMTANQDFERDPVGEKFLLTFNPSGILRRVR
jgi:cephalosporin hydroxylase